MKVGEHSKVDDKPAICKCEKTIAMMLTYNRAGLLTGTVGSFLETTPEIPLLVFDDGSDAAGKTAELECIRECGIQVFELPHSGFAESWLRAFKFVRGAYEGYDSVIMLEDDLIFAEGWANILRRMQVGIGQRGFKQGMTTCFRPHENAQSAIIDLNGVRAYQSMAHTWHANMMPFDILQNMDVIEESVKEVRESKSKLGLDVYMVGNIAHKLNRVSFVSEESWVAHTGVNDSIVAGQGYRSCRHSGVNLVKELERFKMKCPMV